MIFLCLAQIRETSLSEMTLVPIHGPFNANSIDTMTEDGIRQGLCIVHPQNLFLPARFATNP